MARSRRIITWAGLGLSLLCAGANLSAAGSSTPIPYAGRDISFKAKKSATLWWNGKTEAVVYWEYHAAPDKWRVEYLAPASARGRVMIRRGGTIWQWEPRQKRVYVTSGDELVDEADTLDPLLSKNYNIQSISKTKREADRWCSMLRVTPRHEGKSKWLLWTDRDTGIILKRERYGPHGELEMALQCLEFIPGKQDSTLFDSKHLPAGKIVKRNWPGKNPSQAELRDILGINPPSELEGGFKLRSSAIVGNPQTAQLMYTDGLLTISLFASPAGSPSKSNRDHGHPVRLGKLDAVASTFGHLASVTWHVGKHSYTLVGGVGEHQLLDIAGSLPTR